MKNLVGVLYVVVNSWVLLWCVLMRMDLLQFQSAAWLHSLGLHSATSPLVEGMLIPELNHVAIMCAFRLNGGIMSWHWLTASRY